MKVRYGALSSKSMKVAMNIAWSVTKFTGITLAKTSSVVLKTMWKLTGGAKK